MSQPRWFKNLKFGRDVTNTTDTAQIVERFRSRIEFEMRENTFNSIDSIVDDVVGGLKDDLDVSWDHGPIIEEVISEPDSPSPLPESPRRLAESPIPMADSPIPIADSPIPIAHSPIPISDSPADPIESYVPSPEESPFSSPIRSPIQSAIRPSIRSSIGSSSRSSIRSPVPLPIPSPILESQDRRYPLRKRVKTLDYARQQRPVYRFGELVAISEPFPEKYDYSKRKQDRVPRQQICRTTKLPKDATKLPDMILHQSKKGNFRFTAKDSIQCTYGIMNIPPGQLKPECKVNGLNQYSFFVAKGVVIIAIRKDNEKQKFHADEQSDWFIVEPGYRYSIQNIGSTPASLVYIVEKDLERYDV